MNKISAEITKKIKNLPEPYLKEILNFIDFMEQKIKKNSDTEYLQSIPGMTESIKKAERKKPGHVKHLKTSAGNDS